MGIRHEQPVSVEALGRERSCRPTSDHVQRCTEGALNLARPALQLPRTRTESQALDIENLDEQYRKRTRVTLEPLRCACDHVGPGCRFLGTMFIERQLAPSLGRLRTHGRRRIPGPRTRACLRPVR